MSNHRTSDEILLSYQAKFGDDDGKLFHTIENEFQVLLVKLNYVRALYTDEEALRILRETDNHFFSIVKIALVESIVVGIGRLFDPIESFKRLNVSLEHLSVKLESQEIIDRVLSAKEYFNDKIKIHRDKKIAHSDFETMMDRLEIPTYNFEHIQGLMDMLKEIFNSIHIVHFKSSTYYEGLEIKSQLPIVNYIKNAIIHFDLVKTAYHTGAIPHWRPSEGAHVKLYDSDWFELVRKE
ncbi:MAG: hypothetical protein RL437_461 [Actinomycetota bacterium]|jgi:hypothetical protein